jgi:Flp pilus assembly protein TadG
MAPMLAAVLHQFRLKFSSNERKIPAFSVWGLKPAHATNRAGTSDLGAAVMSIRSFFQSFVKSTRGNVAPIFAIAVIPTIGLTGMAVDYSRANSVKVAVQAALDATALSLAKSAQSLSQQSTPGDDQLSKKANAYFTALFNHPEATIDTLKATYSANSGTQLQITATGHLPTTFTRIMGFNQIDVGSSATIKWGNTRLRVALVLDNTGSMLDNDKIGALKAATSTASNSLLTQLKNAATVKEDVYVSIIPFVKDVNVGKANYTANWIDWTEWEAEPPVLDTANGGSKPANWYTTNRGSPCPFSSSTHGFGCTDRPATASGASATNTVPDTDPYNRLICPGIDNGNKKPLKANVYYNGCYNSWSKCVGSTCTCTTSNTSICSCSGSGSGKTCTVATGYREHTWRPTTNNTYTQPLILDGAGVPWATPGHQTWNGCVVDRGNKGAYSSGDYDANVEPPVSGSTATMFAAEQYASCPQAVLPLGSTLDPTAFGNMNKLVNDMVAAGNTNQAIGLAHGWMSLTGGGPYPAPPAIDTNYIYNYVIILLTDGLNTQDRWYTKQSSIDDREQLTCDNINDKKNPLKITLYTIQVNTGGDPTSALLKKCAGSPGVYPDISKWFMVTTPSGIGEVFTQIGKQLSQLRVAK